MEKRSLNYIPGFDGLRGISIILVLLTHLGLYHYLPESVFIRNKVWLLISGGTGVFIFFSLSGFLITRILLIEKERTSKINYKKFYIKRFLRLAPPLLVFLVTISFLMFLVIIPVSKYGIIFSFFYIYNFIPIHLYTGELGHTWSLGVEEQFYFLWPIFIAVIPKNRIGIFFISMMLLCVVAAYLLPAMPSISENFFAYRWFFPAAGPIFLGSIMSWISYHSPDHERFYRSYFILGISLCLFISPLYFPQYFDRIIFIVQAMGMAFFLNWVFHQQTSRIVGLLEWKPLKLLGRVSYGIYIWQGLFLRTGPGGNLMIQQFPLNILLTFVVAYISYITIEKWSGNLKKSLIYQ